MAIAAAGTRPMAGKMQALAAARCVRSSGPGVARLGPAANGAGNVAFDENREETLRKQDDGQQRVPRYYLDWLHSAKDRAEFEPSVR